MDKINNFQDIDALLANYRSPIGRSRVYKLDTMKRFMHFLGDPQDAVNIVHVAGTSGKTSTSYFIDAILRESGYKVGLTVSPHIDKVSERAQIDGKPLVDSEYFDELTNFINLVEESSEKLSYFELLVGFAYWLFARRNMDFAVVEVGLGGLLDGTNVVNHPGKISVITDIGLDHTEILGNTLDQITAQKAGIILPESQAFIQKQPDEVIDIVSKIAKEKSATLHIVNSAEIEINNLELPKFQRRNLNLAKSVCNFIMQIEGNEKVKDAILARAANVYIPARMEIVKYKSHTIILDGSHNQQKIAALVKGLQDKFGNHPIPVLVSFGKNKQADIRNTLSELHKVSNEVILTKFTLKQDEFREGIEPKDLELICNELGFASSISISDPELAFNQLLSKEDTIVMITGSYYLLNHIRPLIKDFS